MEGLHHDTILEPTKTSVEAGKMNQAQKALLLLKMSTIAFSLLKNLSLSKKKNRTLRQNGPNS